MQIKEIAQHFAKAGVNVRPKALQRIKDCISKHKQMKVDKGADAVMQDENDMKVLNDSADNFESEQLIRFVIKKFEEMKAYGGESSNAFLEVSTTNKILEYYEVEGSKVDEEKQENNGSKQASKSIKESLKHVEDVIMEEKNKEVSDPIFQLLASKVIILDSFTDIPIPSLLGTHITYSTDRKRSILSDADSRTSYFKTRMNIFEDFILSEYKYERARIRTVESAKNTSNRICLSRINGLIGSIGKVCCMGIIVLGEDGELHLEDDSLRVKLNFMFAHSDRRSYFTQGSIVIAEGEYRTETFFVDFVAQPPLKFKQRAKDIIVNDNFGAYTYAKNKIIKESDGQISSEAISISKSKQDIPNKINENEAIVVISSLSLDEPSSISSLDEIFKAYEQINWLSTFILCGEFISNKKVDTLDFDGIKFCFDELAALIKKYDRLKNECRFVLIPGVNDAANDQILPLSPLCDYFTSSFSGIKNVTFACNPCRINFYGKQIVICRYNYLKKIKKNSIYLGGDINNEPQENMEESKEIIEPNQSDEIDGKKYLNLNIIESIKIANTVLLQANLIPLPYLIQPVYWDYAECLNLNTIPDYLILADTCAQYTVDNKEDFETFVVNPGNFSCSKTFSIIYPHLGKVEESSLSNNME